MKVTGFVGFDPSILRNCKIDHILQHQVISWMLVLSVVFFAVGTYYFFNISVKDVYYLWLVVFFMSYIYLSFTRMILATHDHNLAYFDRHNKLEPFNPDFSVTLRLFIIFVFSILCGCGILFWCTDAVFHDVLSGLQSGLYDNQPEALKYLGITNKNYYSINNITDRFKVLKLVFGYYSFVLIIPFLLTSFILLLPFAMKFFISELSNGEYELKETATEAAIIDAEYEYMWDYINHIRITKYGLHQFRYEVYDDPPYNTKRRIKPLDIEY